jgi:hypothetical protein
VTNDCLQSYRTPIDYEKGFAFESLPPGAYKLVAVCDGMFSALTNSIRVQPRETKTVYLDVKLWQGEFGGPTPPPSLPLDGRILDEFDRPVRGATVTVRRPRWDGGERETQSQPDGRFGFCNVLTGKFTLEVKHVGYRTGAVRLDFDGVTGKPLEIKLRRR